MNFRKEIQEIVGNTYRDALFYNFPGGLRFELSEGDGGSPLDQVLVALRKATIICDDVFAGDELILLHLQAFAPPSRFRLRAKIRELRLAGIFIPKVREAWLEKDEDEGWDDNDDRYWINCAFEVPASKLQNLLWCAFTTDFRPLRPNPNCRVYLLNTNKGIVVHPYDDRGMDIISQSTSALAGLYERHNDLLLDYDMEAMRKTFDRS
jgi:hypothetical protein